MTNNYRGLVATCLTAGALVLGGCSRLVECHEGDIRGGTFNLESRQVGKNNYKGHLELVSDDKKRKRVVKSVGASICSDDSFTIVSMKDYRDGKLDRVYAPCTNYDRSYGVPAFDQEMDIVFEKDAGRRALKISCQLDYYRILDHLNNCSGEDPCYILKKK